MKQQYADDKPSQNVSDIQVYSDLDRLHGDNPAHGEIDTPMSIMRRAMQEKSYDRLHEYETALSPAGDFFDFREYKGVLIFGSYSWTAPNEKLRWLNEYHAEDIGAGVWVTPSSIARDYLSLKYKDRRVRMTSKQYEACVKEQRGTPRYAEPCALYDGAFYFDLSGAYWQIVRACGWDVNYLPGQYIAVNSNATDFPFRFMKMARNCLVTVGQSRAINMWTGSKIDWKKTYNKFLNHCLWRLVCDVLNGIAVDVLRAGARYIYTDGYICSGENSHAVVEALESWGVRFSLKRHGDYGVVRAPGSYMVGDYQSKPYRDSERKQAFSNLYDPKVEWLRPRFRRFVELADQDWLFYKGMEGYDD